MKQSLIRGGGGSPKFLVTIFVLKTSKNITYTILYYIILSFKMKGEVISDHFLMLWFQKNSLNVVGFRTFFGGGGGVRES